MSIFMSMLYISYIDLRWQNHTFSVDIYDGLYGNNLYINVRVTLGVIAAYLFLKKITVALLTISKKLNFSPVTRKDITLL